MLILAMGCSTEGAGEPRHDVTGKITLDGKPMDKGRILFEADPPQGKGPVSAEISNGTYTAQVPAGKQRVQFSVEKMIPSTMPGSNGEMESAEALPARYNRDSKIFMEVSPDGENEFSYQLKSR